MTCLAVRSGIQTQVCLYVHHAFIRGKWFLFILCKDSLWIRNALGCIDQKNQHTMAYSNAYFIFYFILESPNLWSSKLAWWLFIPPGTRAPCLSTCPFLVFDWCLLGTSCWPTSSTETNSRQEREDGQKAKEEWIGVQVCPLLKNVPETTINYFCL